MTWRFGGALVSAVFQFGVGVLLARLLSPADFGLVGLAYIILGLTTLFGDLGMGGAVIQRQQLSERHIRTAFTFSVLLGVGLGVLIALLAPLGAVLMKEPRLTAILRVLSIGFALKGVAVVSGSLLSRRLDLKSVFYVDLSTSILGYAAVSVTLALLGFGVWSLIWGSLVQGLLSSAGRLAIVRHDMRPLLGRAELRDLIGYGTGLSLNRAVNYLALNGDNFVVGRWIGPAGLGLYTRAYSLMNLPLTYMAGIMSGVLFPVFAQVQADRERLRRGYLLLSRLTALTAAPVLAGMGVAAPHLITGIYGPGWEGTVMPLQILCLAGYFRAMYHLDGSVTHATGKIYQELGVQVGYVVLVVSGSLLGIRFGIAGVAVGVACAILYMYLAMGSLALRISGTTWGQYLRSQRQGVGIGLLIGSFALAARMGLERLGAPSLLIALVLMAVCAVLWIWSLLVVIDAPEFQAVSNRIPLRLRAVAAIPPRAHRRLRMHYSRTGSL